MTDHDWISNVCLISKYDKCTINIRFKHSSQNHQKRYILKVPIVTIELWNNHIHIHINMFKKLLIELFEHQLPTKTEKKKPNIPNEQNNCDFFFSFISAILSHSEKRFLTLYFWRYKCIIMYLWYNSCMLMSLQEKRCVS